MWFLTSSSAMELFCMFRTHMYVHVDDVIRSPANGSHSKGCEGEGCKLVNMDVDNAGFKILLKNPF